MLEVAEARGMMVLKTWFDKEESKKVSYESGGCKTVVDYIMVKQRDRWMVEDVKVIRNEPCLTQHKLMVCKLVLREQMRRKKEKFVSKCKTWKLKEIEVRREFMEKVQVRVALRGQVEGSVEGVWKEMTVFAGGVERCVW